MLEPDLTVEDAPTPPMSPTSKTSSTPTTSASPATTTTVRSPSSSAMRRARIVAGLAGFTWGGALKIETLWVNEDYCGQDYGTRLMHAAEREAVGRGCAHVILDTHSFQAPGFYPKLGYVQCGVADDWPAGHQQPYFSKRLVQAPGVSRARVQDRS